MKDTNRTFEKTKQQVKNSECKPASEFVGRMLQTLESDVIHPLTTGFPSFDKESRYRLRGLVLAIIGFPGTFKSIVALDGCRKNVKNTENHAITIYSSMEMSVFQMMMRLITMTMDPIDRVQYGDHIDEVYTKAFKKGDKAHMKKIQIMLEKALDDFYGPNLLLSFQSNMNYEKYRDLIDANIKLYGRVDELVIDGNSMLEGGDTQEAIQKNSQMIKRIANDYNILVKLIVHCSRSSDGKSYDKFSRWNLRVARGSQKIEDNADLFLMLSACKDNKDDEDGIENKGYALYWPKRQSGRKIRKVFNLDPMTLHINETDEDPEWYDEKARGKPKGQEEPTPKYLSQI